MCFNSSWNKNNFEPKLLFLKLGSQTSWWNFKITMVQPKLFAKSSRWSHSRMIPTMSMEDSRFFPYVSRSQWWIYFILFRYEKLDNKNILSYQILLGVGIFFVITGALTSYLMKKILPKKLICKWKTNGLAVWVLRKFIILAGCWISISALTCVGLNILTEFNSIVISFVVFLSCCSCANMVMAVAVNLFPTKYRGMATAFILMFGRLGGFVGSNLVGALLSYKCSLIFYINGGLLISKSILMSLQSPTIISNFIQF